MVTTITALFITTSTAFGLPPGLLNSICYVETKHNISAYHKADGTQDSIGICQVQLRSARTIGFKGTAKQLMDPSVNIVVAGAILRHEITRYKSVRRGVIAYNIGNAKGLTTSKYQVRVFTAWGHK